jgi:hypothetical protein
MLNVISKIAFNHNHFSKGKTELKAPEAEALRVEAEALKNSSASASLLTTHVNDNNSFSRRH